MSAKSRKKAVKSEGKPRAAAPPIARARPVAVVVAAVLLVAATLAVYWPVFGHKFLNEWDDPNHVTENPHVLAGLTAKSIAWAFSTTYFANWHPLTWMSHMMDVQIYGLNPAGHHATSLIFHILNALLLLWVLSRMTGSLWKSAFVAALFAVHPLHVESVAWISERKDVLSTFFWLLTMLAYVWYVERPRMGRYALVALAFAMGLMSKTMLVTLPVALLLLDYWPLKRLGASRGHSWRLPWRMIWEKAPLFLMAAAASAITISVNRAGEALGAGHLSLGMRIETALIAYVGYLGKMVWPHNLANFYLHPYSAFPIWQVLGAVLLLLAISALAIVSAKRHGYLAVGWLWYLGTLLPVIGLVQVGVPVLMADRFTYVPLIGIFVMVAWGIPDLVSSLRRPDLSGPRRIVSGVMAAAATIVLLALAISARNQATYWKNSVVLWRHALAVTENNYVAHYNLGLLLAKGGRLKEGIAQFSDAVRINPNYTEAQYSLGVANEQQGNLDEAVRHYREALRINHGYSKARGNLALILERQGKLDEAAREYLEELRINPADATVHNGIGNILFKQGKLDEAGHHFAEAARIKPDYALAHANLAVVLFNQSRYADSWREADLCRRCGGAPPPSLLRALPARLPGPAQ